ncbi:MULTISPECIES: GDP-mannose pyrophosphatase NudK [unclassified Arcicella]|uniref:GDP-mannose pyrophosphatase NudK n=1 Tax=unclassified Arcicella TaxID=2644986 RepID=UPI0028588C84|nr:MULTISPECIES: GDP-mannose pyrophosphatase NudK [unclassified Arcicella]MDR6564219.1 nudix-type nucleoside diphosphatase (YffH/AdpP family) [Arcicella sp. BE51]MDR6811534.1 nudix-type nucleoside diphosphatase (YffH/AdpP family) [Arcicella sp. BE140]MDR6823060.1 nudix-type nucleoside diphosphatase (YffH/AdpP family) [Arcicella sp. BE139]
MTPSIKIKKTEVLSDNWYTLRKITFDIEQKDGSWITQSREAYDRGNGAVILLYNVANKTVILTEQFRMPTYHNGNPTGMLIEACAGLLDEDNAEDCIKRETEEETGFRITEVKKIYEAYMSPGSVTEILYFFIAEYDKSQQVSEGGGVEGEHENIEVLELPFEKALDMITTGEIKDAKTIMLLQYIRLNNIL